MIGIASLVLESILVRIFDMSGGVVGAGMVLDQRFLLTCDHVLGHSRTETIHFDMPLSKSRKVFNANLLVSDSVRDIAVLECEELPQPSRQVPKIVRTNSIDLWDASFRVFGFPLGFTSGIWSSGQIKAQQTLGWIQLDDARPVGQRVEQGFSGSPVWCDNVNGIVGIVVAASKEPSIRTSFLIPADLLLGLHPVIERSTVGYGGKSYYLNQLHFYKQLQKSSDEPKRFEDQIRHLEHQSATIASDKSESAFLDAIPSEESRNVSRIVRQKIKKK